MLRVNRSSARSAESRLRAIFSGLDAASRVSLLDFAEFLAQKAEPEEHEVPSPQKISRPESESVVKAIKRLSATYPMIDRSKLLNETSSLMTQHVLQGRAVVEVIDELEVVFRGHYERLLDDDK